MARENLPEYTRKETIETTNVPDFGSATRNLASVSDGLSYIGSKVAQTASTAQAVKMGTEMGQNPKGDLLPPITEFDKTLADTYHQQAHSILTLQAEKLLSDADNEMSQASRLTPDLIKQTNMNVSQGLSSILEQAPSAIKSNLQVSFASSMIRQNHQYTNKMISQQKEEEKNNLLNATNIGYENIYENAASGNDMVSDAEAKEIEANARAGVKNNTIDVLQAHTMTKTAQQVNFNGKLIRRALEAQKEGKFEQFQKDFAESSPESLGMTHQQKMTAAHSLQSYMGTLNSLRSQDENLRVAQFNTAIAQDVTGITGDMVAELKQNVSPQRFEETNLNYIRAIKSAESTKASVDSLISGFSDPNHFARFTEEQKNKAFDLQTQAHQKMMKEAGVPTTMDESQAAIASTAAGPIPGYVSTLKTKLASTSPDDIEGAGIAIMSLQKKGVGQNLGELGEKPLDMYALYSNLKNTMPREEAAKLAHEVVYDKDPETIEANNKKWNNYLQNSKATTESSADFAFRKADIKNQTDTMVNPQVYGNKLFKVYEGFYKAFDGNEVAADNRLKNYVQTTYGKTGVNGFDQTSFLPIEKVYNLPQDAGGSIQDDLHEQLKEKFNSSKLKYLNGEVNEYWELKARQYFDSILANREKMGRSPFPTLVPSEFIQQGQLNNTIRDWNKGEPIEVTRHVRGGEPKTYKVFLQANPFLGMTNDPENPIAGGWDITVETETGLRPIERIAPYSEISTYRPNIKRVKDRYLSLNGLR